MPRIASMMFLLAACSVSVVACHPQQQAPSSQPSQPSTGAAQSLSAVSSSSAQECAAEGDAEQLCAWDGAVHSMGRTCKLDVERIRPEEKCDFAHPPRAMDDHKPMCISVTRKEHIAFFSRTGRAFRVRRLVRVAPTNGAGQACPLHPFQHHFEPTILSFAKTFDSTAIDTQEVNPTGCVYKLEVQFDRIDPSAPAEPGDPMHRHFECRDPHVKLSQ